MPHARVLCCCHSSGRAQLTHDKDLSPVLYRADIDGLRAIAVILVIAFHAFPDVVPGGFVGVDVFFVISGYLISGIILRGLQRATFAFRDFYARRARRIFPALSVVLVACVVAGYVVLTPREYTELGKHVFGGAAFVSNVLLWREVGYFDPPGTAKPLLHLWSLGVEEQFYLLWPVVLVLAWRARQTVRAILAVLATSLAFSVVLSERMPTAAFLLPFTRFWELMLGAALIGLHAPVEVLFGRGGDRMRNAAAFAGLMLVLLSALTFDGLTIFPGWRALQPTAGAALILAAGASSWMNRRILSSSFLVWVGLISYPLYLWHWPLLSFSRIVADDVPPVAVRLTAIGVSVLLAWGTYAFVEKPIRFGRFGAGRLATLCMSLVLVACSGLVIRRQAGFRSRLNSAALAMDIKRDDPFDEHRCPAALTERFALCAIVDASRLPTIGLIGDSYATAAFLGLSEHYSAQGENLLLLAKPGCPPFFHILLMWGWSATSAPLRERCRGAGDQLNFVMRTASISTVIFANRGQFYANGSGIAGGRDVTVRFTGDTTARTNAEAYARAMLITVERVRRANKHIVFFGSVPELGFNPERCFTKFRPRRINQCANRIATFRKRDSAFALSLHQLDTLQGVEVVRPSDALCDSQWCRGIQDGHVLYFDFGHLSREGSRVMVRRLVATGKLQPRVSAETK